MVNHHQTTVWENIFSRETNLMQQLMIRSLNGTHFEGGSNLMQMLQVILIRISLIVVHCLGYNYIMTPRYMGRSSWLGEEVGM